MKNDYFESYIETQLGEKQLEFKFKRIVYNYRRFFPIATGSKVLDIGIGCGEMLSAFKQMGYKNYQGIDISPSTISFCQRLGLNCTLISSTEDFLNNHGNHFDLITLCDVLEHIDKPKLIEFVRPLHHAIKPNGTIIIQVPNAQSPEPALHRYNDMTHETSFTENSLRQLLTVAGFKNIKFYPYEIIIGISIQDTIRKIIREGYLKTVHLRRILTGDIHPKILSPIFFAVAKKTA